MSGEVILIAVVAVCAFAMGYAFGAAPIQEDLRGEVEPEGERPANVQLAMEAEKARKAAAEAEIRLKIAMERNAELVEEIVCLKSRL